MSMQSCRKLKFIFCCEPGSPIAMQLELDTGGYYVAHRILREDGNYSGPYPAFTGDGLFEDMHDPTLLALLREAEGEYSEADCAYFYTTGKRAVDF